MLLRQLKNVVSPTPSSSWQRQAIPTAPSRHRLKAASHHLSTAFLPPQNAVLASPPLSFGNQIFALVGSSRFRHRDTLPRARFYPIRQCQSVTRPPVRGHSPCPPLQCPHSDSCNARGHTLFAPLLENQTVAPVAHLLPHYG